MNSFAYFIKIYNYVIYNKYNINLIFNLIKWFYTILSVKYLKYIISTI